MQGAEAQGGLYNAPQRSQELKMPRELMGSLSDVCRMLLMARDCYRVREGVAAAACLIPPCPHSLAPRVQLMVPRRRTVRLLLSEVLF